MAIGEYIIKIGKVVSVYDGTGGNRIRVALDNEIGLPIEEIPYAFPLLPKTFQSIPKVGEAVQILTSQIDNNYSQRYYLGPIISQPQNMENAPYSDGLGNSVSLLQTKVTEPLESINHFAETKNAFPDKEDVAIIGRKGEDLIFKGTGSGNEVDIRCGVRYQMNGSIDPNLTGPVIFNSKNPAFIQMRHKSGLLPDSPGSDGVINVVANRVNLVSYDQKGEKDPSKFMLNTEDGKNALIDDEDLQSMINELHNCTYADILIPILRKMCDAITNHKHPIGNKVPSNGEEIKAVKALNLETIRSPYVKIS